MELTLFNKYEGLKFQETGMLFPPDFKSLRVGKCPFCGNKLYEMRGRPLFYCKSKKHKNRFVISREKVGNFTK